MRKAWGILLLLPLAGALYALWSQPVQLTTPTWSAIINLGRAFSGFWPGTP